MTASDATTPIDTLPPEILQEVWGHLSFYDLMRCQRVCKKWNAYLPGDDPTLRKALFSPLTRQNNPTPLYYEVVLEVDQRLEVQELTLALPPRTTFELGVCNLNQRWLRDSGFQLHPVIGKLSKYSDLIHPSLSPRNRHQIFEFYRLEDIRVSEQNVKSTGESWERMLSFTPKVRTLDIDLQWIIDLHPDDGEYSGSDRRHRVDNPDGVTVLEVVNLV